MFARVEDVPRLRLRIAVRGDADQLHRGMLAHRLAQPLPRRLQLREFVRRRDDSDSRLVGRACDARAYASEQGAEKHREQRPDEEENEGLGEDGRGEVAAANHPG